jgi:hypothetical protein
MGYRWRRMYYLTGQPGWLRFGYSPGWVGRSPTGLPPTAQWLIQRGLLPEYLQSLGAAAPMPPPAAGPTTPVPPAPYAPAFTTDQEKQILEQQVKALEAQLATIKKRLDELSR